MPYAAFLLRLLLAFALVAAGLPGAGMASDHAADPSDSIVSSMPAPTSCHDLEIADAQAAGADTVDEDCCSSTDCLCDCMQHLPLAALAVPVLVHPDFAITATAPRSSGPHGRAPSDRLRPPIG